MINPEMNVTLEIKPLLRELLLLDQASQDYSVLISSL